MTRVTIRSPRALLASTLRRVVGPEGVGGLLESTEPAHLRFSLGRSCVPQLTLAASGWPLCVTCQRNYLLRCFFPCPHSLLGKSLYCGHFAQVLGPSRPTMLLDSYCRDAPCSQPAVPASAALGSPPLPQAEGHPALAPSTAAT